MRVFTSYDEFIAVGMYQIGSIAVRCCLSTTSPSTVLLGDASAFGFGHEEGDRAAGQSAEHYLSLGAW